MYRDRNAKLIDSNELIKILGEVKEISAMKRKIIAKLNKVDIYSSLEAYIKTSLEDVEFRLIYMRGYTPSFNDGDPCKHSFDFSFGKRHFLVKDKASFDNISEKFDYFYDELSDDDFDIEPDETDYVTMPLLSEKDAVKIEELCESINELLCIKNETDFRIKVYKSRNGEVKVSIDEYDPN